MSVDEDESILMSVDVRVSGTLTSSCPWHMAQTVHTLAGGSSAQPMTSPETHCSA